MGDLVSGNQTAPQNWHPAHLLGFGLQMGRKRVQPASFRAEISAPGLRPARWRLPARFRCPPAGCLPPPAGGRFGPGAGGDLGGVDRQVHAVMDDRPRDALRPELPGPPGAREFRLVDDLGHDPRAQQGEQAVGVLGAQVMARPGGQTAVQPVDPVQALDDAYPPPAQAQQAGDVTRPSGDQHRVAGGPRQVVADLDAARRQPGGQFCLEGHHAPHAMDLWKQADVHQSRFPTQRAGTPAQISFSRVDLSSTALAATIVPRPTRRVPSLHSTLAPEARMTSSSTSRPLKADFSMGWCTSARPRVTPG